MHRRGWESASVSAYAPPPHPQHAHHDMICCQQAADALELSSALAGQAYFITDDEQWVFWDFVGDFLEPLGYGRPRIPLPGLLIFVLAWILQFIVIPLVCPSIQYAPSHSQLAVLFKCKMSLYVKTNASML